MHEFEEASSIIHKEVDEDAHIILGMAIDPTMEDELRVTVIATGIGRIEQAQKVDSFARQAQRRINTEGIMPEINYDYLQIPTVVRHRALREEVPEEQPKKRTFLRRLTGGASSTEEDLTIPTFIRRQAD